jgi:4-hydroxythreonine-4-phosphate dehydrogenase
MVTAPVHKGVINDAGIPFSGHTEYLAERTGTRRVVMMLAGGGLRVALVTTHLPLKDVPAAVTRTAVEETCASCIARWGEIRHPAATHPGGRLNPHAGEGGYLGREEIEVITPVLERLRVKA